MLFYMLYWIILLYNIKKAKIHRIVYLQKSIINIYFFKDMMLLSSLNKFVKSHLIVRLTLIAGGLATVYYL